MTSRMHERTTSHFPVLCKILIIGFVSVL